MLKKCGLSFLILHRALKTSLDNKFLGDGRDSGKYLLIVATAERGLCGGFNSSIVKLAKSRIADLDSQKKR